MTSQSRLIPAVLFTGVVVSFVLLSTGLVLYFADSPASAALLNAGVLVLMATPVVRIVVLAAEFMTRGEYAFGMIALGVLLLLGVSVYIGFAQELK